MKPKNHTPTANLLVGGFLLSFSIAVNATNNPTSMNASLTTPLVFNEMASDCAANVDVSTLQAIVRTESSFNPYAIGVVRGAVKQPSTFEEAVATAKALHAAGKNFSMGLAQINRYNLDKYGLDYESVFDVCKNLKVGADILAECYGRAPGKKGQEALQEALSCYYSGNFRTGFTTDLKGLPSYVERILTSAKHYNPNETIRLATVNETPGVSTIVPAIDASAKPVKVVKPKAPNNKTSQAAAAVKVSVRSRTQSNQQSTINPYQERSNTTLLTQERNERNTPAAWDAFSDW